MKLIVRPGFFFSVKPSHVIEISNISLSPGRNVDLLEIDRLVGLLRVVHLDLVRAYICIDVEVALFKHLVACC